MLGLVGLLGVVAGVRHLATAPDDAARLRGQAESLAAEHHWAEALNAWRTLNAGRHATASSHLGEGKACLALGRAAQAEAALRRAVAAAPEDPEAALLLLEISRVEDRPLDAFALGWTVHDRLPPEARPELLRELTLGALADLPDDLARETLSRWLEADPADVEARVALHRRIAAEPRPDDPDRDARLAALTSLVEQHPGHLGAREALITALADAGEPEQGRRFLEAWPEAQRDGRYWRLAGRWELEYDRHPEQAAAAFEQALRDFPQDWRTHYRLARALQNSGQAEAAKRQAAVVARIRELLDPMTLARTLDAAFARLGDPAASRALAELCDRAGLARLAEAWRAAATLPGGNGRRDEPTTDVLAPGRAVTPTPFRPYNP